MKRTLIVLTIALYSYSNESCQEKLTVLDKAEHIAYLIDPVSDSNNVDLPAVDGKIDLIMKFFPSDDNQSAYWKNRLQTADYRKNLFSMMVDYIIRDTINATNGIGFDVLPVTHGSHVAYRISSAGVSNLMAQMPPFDTVFFNINRRLECLRSILPFPNSGCIYPEEGEFGSNKKYNTELELDISSLEKGQLDLAEYARVLLTTVLYYVAVKLPKPSKSTLRYIKDGRQLQVYILR